MHPSGKTLLEFSNEDNFHFLKSVRRKVTCHLFDKTLQFHFVNMKVDHQRRIPHEYKIISENRTHGGESEIQKGHDRKRTSYVFRRVFGRSHARSEKRAIA